MILPGEILNQRDNAVNKIDRFITFSILSGERLPSGDLKQYHNRNYALGWRIKINVPDSEIRELHVLVDDDFPYKLPRIVVFPAPPDLSWPHLERDGYLCILPTNTAVSWETPEKVLSYIIGKTYQLIKESCLGENQEDFREEFLSYWDMAAGENSHSFISLIKPNGPSRNIVCWRGKKRRVVADDRESISHWLQRWREEKEGKDYSIHDGFLFWLPKLFLPSEYPNTTTDIRDLMQKQHPKTARILENLISSNKDGTDILLGGETSNGVCFAAINLLPPKPIGGPANRGNQLQRGFRPGHADWKILLSRHRLKKAIVNRADHLWVHGRDQDPQQKQLREARVAILGCGSLGGSLAKLLSQAGIGNLLLVDGQDVEWPNISRHELGACSIDMNKASELAKKIKRSYPHLGEISARDCEFSPTNNKLIDELSSYTLIISTTGNWAMESFLNNLQQNKAGFPPVLYGWVEANVMAAHAVLIAQNGACLRCGVSDKGRPLLEVVTWDEGKDILHEPACGGLFTPYGSVELCWAHALLAEASIESLIGNYDSAIHRIWIGSKTRMEAAGGTWSRNWIDAVGDPGSGGIKVERKWAKSQNCPVCNQRVYDT